MKKLLLFVLLTIFNASLQAQYSLTGVLQSQSQTLIGAEVQLFRMGSDVAYGQITDKDGVFIFENLTGGEYRLVATYLGFKKYRTRITLSENTNLDPITLEDDVIEIDGVEITGTMIQAIQNGDTTAFNAAAFKTLPDADAKDLIAKIPGITIENGTVKANGENVQKVTVDGREFFGNDPNIALNTLPAEIIDRIEIIDEKSEQAQFTGFNDGNTTKTINIVTKQDKRNGEFGKLYAGYGENDRYQAGGNINIFKGDKRISLIGLSNNINEQNFSTEDLLGVVGSSGNNRRFRGGGPGGRGGGATNNFLVDQQNGVATTHSAGINFSDRWGTKTDVTASYFFNNADNISTQLINQDYYTDTDFQDTYKEDNIQNGDNLNHRIQGRLSYKINDKNSLTYSTQVSLQDNEQEEVSSTLFLRRMSIANGENLYTSSKEGFNLSNRLLYRYAFEKKGRSLSLSLNQSLRKSDGMSLLGSIQKVDTTTINELNQIADNGSKTNGISSNISYTEPIGERNRLMFSYEIERTVGENNTSTYDGENQNPNQLITGLSNDQSTIENRHNFGSSYQWQKEKTTLMLRASIEYTGLSSDQVIPIDIFTEKSYLNLLPFAMLRHEFSKTKNIRVFYRPRTNNPSASQLSETVDNTNPLQLSKGNFDLNQSYEHSIFTRYSATNSEKGTVFFAFISGNFSNNYISQRTYLNGNNVPLYASLGIDNRAQLSLPENIGGYMSLRSYVTYGLPVNPIKSKLNFNLSGNYNKVPSIINDLKNSNNSTTFGIGISLTSNISDKVDFTISSNTNLGNVKNSLQPELNTNYLNQQSSIKLDVIFPYGITWRNLMTHQIYSGYGEDFDNSFLLGSMSIGKKFLKNNRAEISLSVFDLFNQNQAISRVVSSTYIESIESNVLQRYFMVNFRYDLRHFGVATQVENDRPQEFDRERFRGRF